MEVGDKLYFMRLNGQPGCIPTSTFETVNNVNPDGSYITRESIKEGNIVVWNYYNSNDCLHRLNGPAHIKYAYGKEQEMAYYINGYRVKSDEYDNVAKLLKNNPSLSWEGKIIWK